MEKGAVEKSVTEKALFVDYLCYECSFYGYIQIKHKQTICPNCKTVNDVWLDGEPIPLRHVRMMEKERLKS